MSSPVYHSGSPRVKSTRRAGRRRPSCAVGGSSRRGRSGASRSAACGLRFAACGLRLGGCRRPRRNPATAADSAQKRKTRTATRSRRSTPGQDGAIGGAGRTRDPDPQTAVDGDRRRSSRGRSRRARPGRRWPSACAGVDGAARRTKKGAAAGRGPGLDTKPGGVVPWRRNQPQQENRTETKKPTQTPTPAQPRAGTEAAGQGRNRGTRSQTGRRSGGGLCLGFARNRQTRRTGLCLLSLVLAARRCGSLCLFSAVRLRRVVGLRGPPCFRGSGSCGGRRAVPGSGVRALGRSARGLALRLCVGSGVRLGLLCFRAPRVACLSRCPACPVVLCGAGGRNARGANRGRPERFCSASRRAGAGSGSRRRKYRRNRQNSARDAEQRGHRAQTDQARALDTNVASVFC